MGSLLSTSWTTFVVVNSDYEAIENSFQKIFRNVFHFSIGRICIASRNFENVISFRWKKTRRTMTSFIILNFSLQFILYLEDK